MFESFSGCYSVTTIPRNMEHLGSQKKPWYLRLIYTRGRALPLGVFKASENIEERHNISSQNNVNPMYHLTEAFFCTGFLFLYQPGTGITTSFLMHLNE